MGDPTDEAHYLVSALLETFKIVACPAHLLQFYKHTEHCSILVLSWGAGTGPPKFSEGLRWALQ